jgi:hypothetical protein
MNNDADNSKFWGPTDGLSPAALATYYIERGIAVIPVPLRTKRPVLDGWPSMRLTIETLHTYFGDTPTNIGILLGEASRGLIDIDLDCAEAIKLAPMFLPTTGTIFGRAGKPSSHMLYKATGTVPARVSFEESKGTMLLEIRGTGHQTVGPGSIHTSGEPIVFERCGAPAVVDAIELERAARRLAAATLLVRHWPQQGTRHEIALSLSGYLLNAGWSVEEIKEFVAAVVEAAGDDERDDRLRAVETTATKHANGEAHTGGPRLAELLGSPLVDLFARWLQFKPASRQPTEGDYFKDDRGTWRRWFNPPGDEKVVQLADFSAEILTEIVISDGVDARRQYELYVRGRKVDEVITIDVDQFAEMEWPIVMFGPRAIVTPTPSAKPHLRTAILKFSENYNRRQVRRHSGWVRQDGHDFYLHAGGAIGAGTAPEPENAELDGPLALMKLPTPALGEDLEVACSAMLQVLSVGPDRIMMPLLAAAVRAVLGRTDFSVFVHRPTGVMKSEVAALMQQMFGPEMDARHLPGSWSSTANAIEELVFLAKDAIVVLDDFKPAGDLTDAKLNATADRIFRAQGNGSARGRLNADLTQRPSRPPRGMILATGEELPTGQSLRGRLVPIEVGQGDIQTGPLTIAQGNARDGRLAEGMASFIRSCADNLGELQARLAKRVQERRNVYIGGHARSGGAAAELEFCFELLVNWIAEVTNENSLTKGEAATLVERFRAAMHHVLGTQADDLKLADPVDVFLDSLRSAIASGRAHIAGMENEIPEADASALGWRADGGRVCPLGSRIGWTNGVDLYLDRQAAYNAAREVAKGGSAVGVGITTLYSRLADRGMLASREASRGSCTVRVKIAGTRTSVVHLLLKTVVELAEPPVADGGAE